MGVCAQCMHFRRVKPASQLLAAAIATTESAVSSALTKIVEDEQKQRDSEAEYKQAQASADKAEWAARPVMSDFCGLREKDGVFLIAEVKNAGGQCADFAEGRPERHACADCKHRVVAPGPEQDRLVDETYASMSMSSTAVGASTQTPDSLRNAARESVGARKGFEVSGAYAAKGILVTAPAYLDHCAAQSRDDEYVVCVLANPHHTCALWEQGEPAAAQAAPQPVAAPATAAAPAPPPPAPPAPPAPPPATAADPATVLVAGNPPLTEAMMTGCIGFFEWVFGVPLTPELTGQIRASVTDDWTKDNRSGIDGIVAQLATFEQIRATTPEAQAFWREQNQAQFVDALRAQPDPVAKALVAHYDAANAPIADGTPPLTQEVAEAAVDFFGFLMTVVTTGEPAPLAADIRTQSIAEIVKGYGALGAEGQQALAEMPKAITGLRALWHDLDDPTKKQYRDQWQAQLGAAVPAAPEAPAEPAAEPASESVFDKAIKAIDEQEDPEIERLRKINPQLAEQKKLQQEQVQLQMMSNIMKMQHDTQMAIISNFKV